MATPEEPAANRRSGTSPPWERWAAASDVEALRRHAAAPAADADDRLVALTLAAFLLAESGAGPDELLDRLEHLHHARESIDDAFRAAGLVGVEVSVAVTPYLTVRLPAGAVSVGLALAKTLVDTGDGCGALAVIDRTPISPPVLLARAEVLVALGRSGDAAAIGAVDVDDIVTAWLAVVTAGALREVHRISEAVDTIDEVLTWGEVPIEIRHAAQLELARCLAATLRRDAAEAQVSAVLDEDPDNSEADALRRYLADPTGLTAATPPYARPTNPCADSVGGIDSVEGELARREAELASLQSELVEAEAERTACEVALATFKATHDSILGPRYVSLDELAARLAATQFRRDNTADAANRAEEAKTRAQQSREALDELGNEVDPPDRALRALYKELARRLHPDFAANPEDRNERDSLMKRVNEAMACRDRAALESIDLETRNRHVVPPPGASIGNRLAYVISKIAELRSKLSALATQTSSMLSSPSARLWEEVLAAEDEGRDLLSEMADDLDTQITHLLERVEQAEDAVSGEPPSRDKH